MWWVVTTNAKKQTLAVELFGVIIVLVSLCVATRYLDSNFFNFIYDSLSYRVV